MQNWDDLKYCLALKRYRTMTAAASALGTNTATVSRRIDRMNETYRHPLFKKEGHQWRPTRVAEHLISLAENTEEALQTLEVELNDDPKELVLRISGVFPLLQSDLGALISNLYRTIDGLELTVAAAPASLAFGETDIAVSTTPPEEGRIISQKIGTITERVYAHRNFAGSLEGWAKLNGDTIHEELHEQLFMAFDSPAKLSIDGVDTAYQIIGAFPLCCVFNDTFAQSDRSLVPVDGYPVSTHEIWVSYHTSRKNDPLIRRAIDCISDMPLGDQPTERYSA